MSLIELVTYKSTMKSSMWLTTMNERIDALHSQGTWSLVSLLSWKNLVGCKWILKIKKNSGGSVARRKAICLIIRLLLMVCIGCIFNGATSNITCKHSRLNSGSTRSWKFSLVAIVMDYDICDDEDGGDEQCLRHEQ